MRRKRFRVVMQDGKEFDYLAYNVEQLVYLVKSDDRFSMFYKPSEKEPTWRLDKQELHDACVAMGMKWRVKVRRTMNKRCLGRHSLYGTRHRYSPEHNITINKHLPPAAANVVLWHELGHALRSECEVGYVTGYAIDIVAAWGKCKVRSRTIPYHERPVELEAKAYEQAASYWKLTKEV